MNPIGIMKYDYAKYGDKTYCNVFIDKTQTNGILRFTHEINVTFVLDNEQWMFDGAWHIGVSDMEWKANEEESFEQTFPGLLTEMKNGLKKGGDIY